MVYSFLFIVSLLIPYPSVQHFIWPLHWCLLADICNHTYIPECGTENEEDMYSRRLFIDECDLFEYNCDYERDYYPINYSSCFNIPTTTTMGPPIIPCPSHPPCQDHRFHNTAKPVLANMFTDVQKKFSVKLPTLGFSLPIHMLRVITFMLYNFTKNHYIPPLHSCLMAKICNHTGIKRCGLEKDQHNKRLFLDDCDMFEYNCDYKKVYSAVNDEFCATEESPSVNISSQATTDEHTTSNATTSQTTTTQNQTDSVTITIKTESMTTVSGITTTKCTCMDLPTIPLSNTESSQTIPMTVSTTVPTKNCTCNSLILKTNASTKTTESESSTIIMATTPMTPVSGTTIAKCTCTDLQTIPVSSTQIKLECTCPQVYSELPSMRTAIDNTTEKSSKKIETTAVANESESPNVTESTRESTYANVSRIPIATECTRGNKNSTAIVTTKKQNTNSVIESSATISNSTDTVITGETNCTCMDTEIPTGLSHLETNSTTIPTHLETKQSTTSPITKTKTNTETVSISSQKNSCTCNSVSLETNETITKQTELNSEIEITPTKPMTPVSKITSTKCTCMDLQTKPVTTTESIITSTQTQHHCTCTNSPSEFSSITTIDDKTTHTQLTNDDYVEPTLTKVDTTPKHSCDKYPKHCKRPLTWETTARGETRDFFQILRERFGDRVKILKDTTHFPLRIRKPMENDNDAFYFGTHNDI